MSTENVVVETPLSAEEMRDEAEASRAYLIELLQETILCIEDEDLEKWKDVARSLLEDALHSVGGPLPEEEEGEEVSDA